MFNVTATANNIVTKVPTTDTFMAVVTSAPCRPPVVMIPNNDTMNTAPRQYMRTDLITIHSFAILNCSDVVSTR